MRVFNLGAGSIPERDERDDRLYNTCVCVSPAGDIVARHRKVHLFDIDIPGRITFRESDTLTAGSSLTTFATPHGRFGVGICYDIRFGALAVRICISEWGARGAHMHIRMGRSQCAAYAYPNEALAVRICISE